MENIRIRRYGFSDIVRNIKAVIVKQKVGYIAFRRRRLTAQKAPYPFPC